METRHTQRTSISDGFIETENAATNSVEVTRNAKGDYQWSIKRYFRPDEGWGDGLSEIETIDYTLRHRFCPGKEFNDRNE